MAHTRASRRRAAQLAAVLLLGAVLSGCGLAGRGPSSSRAPERSIAVAVAEVEAIDGVGLRAGRAWDGTNPYLSVSLDIGEGFTGDPSALVDFTLAEIWSQDEVSIGKKVVFVQAGIGQTRDGTVAILSGLSIRAVPYGRQFLELVTDDLEQRYGRWPGSVPERPASLDGAAG